MLFRSLNPRADVQLVTQLRCGRAGLTTSSDQTSSGAVADHSACRIFRAFDRPFLSERIDLPRPQLTPTGFRRGVFGGDRYPGSSPARKNGRAFARPAAWVVGIAAETAAATASDADGDADGVAPLADAVVGDAVDGLVGPFRRSARERLRVGVAGGGVDREHDEAFAIGAVDLEFALVEKGAVTLPAPVYIDLVAADRGRARARGWCNRG